MNLVDHYNKLYKESIQKIKSGEYQFDTLIDSPSDNRFGVTLLLRPDEQTKRKITAFLNEVNSIEPNQYHYPESDMHVTVMSIISCYSGFQLSSISIEEYIKIIQKSIDGVGSFQIKFAGLTASPSCILVQGFPEDDTLRRIRDNLRANFKSSDLEQTIDKRYTIQTAHSTILRLREQLIDKEGFLDIVEASRANYFGTSNVEELEFVFTDWYQRKEKVKTLHKFRLT